MTTSHDSLTAEQVQQIVALVESLDRSSFDHLQVRLGDLRITLGKGAPPALADGPPTPSAQVPGSAPLPLSPPPAVPRPAAATAPPSTPATRVPVPADAALAPRPAGGDGKLDGTVEVVAPLMGVFYAKPQPEAPRFVQLGDTVAPDTTLALVEVMKLFTPVVAGCSGVVEEICVQDGQLVEFQQVLFRVRPSAGDGPSQPVEPSGT